MAWTQITPEGGWLPPYWMDENGQTSSTDPTNSQPQVNQYLAQLVASRGGSALDPSTNLASLYDQSRGGYFNDKGQALYNGGDSANQYWTNYGDFAPAPKHNDGFFQKDAYDPRALLGEMPGLTIPLVALTAGAGSALLGGGAAAGAGDAALAGGGEVGSGYAASAPGWGAVESASTGSSLAAGSSGTGGSMATTTDWTYNSTTGEWEPPPGFNDTGAFDQSGSMSSPTGTSADGMGVDNSSIFGGTASDPFGTGSSSSLSLSDLQNALKAYGLLNGGSANGGGLFGGGGGLFGGGGLGSTAARSAPGLMALAYAAGQPGIDTGQLNAILGRLGGNQDAVVRAATDPVNANIAAGYGDLVQSQALRGIRGSSFGDADIGNYISTTGRTLANAGANAAEGSLALQGNLAGNIASLRAQSQKMKNDLYGRAFDVLGRGLNPGGYAGTTNVNVGGGATPGGAPSASPGIDWTKLLPLATSAFNFATA